MCEFENKVYENLKANGLSFSSELALGAAVSGGADSVSLLISLVNILSELRGGRKSAPAKLFVITVNHNIRPAPESAGDANYVLDLCKKLEEEKGIKICCDLVEFERGAVEAEAQKRGRGIEDAARSLRYNAFEKFICQNKLASLCLAHNRNDQLETVLMRFLQGASIDSAAGIKARRGPYVRPLLNIARAEIESYLTGLGIGWRTDKTNYETDYLRNKIRMKLLPFLDENFEGWQTAVLKGAEKNAEDSDLIQSYLQTFPLSTEEDGSVILPLEKLCQVPEALQYRILREACIRAGETERIPYHFLKDVLLCQSLSFSKRFSGIEITRKNNQLFVKKYSESNTDFVFSDIIERSGQFQFPFGSLDVYNCRDVDGTEYASVRAGQNSIVEKVDLPFCIRNARPGDTVLCADGSQKKVSEIYADWHITPEKRSLVPLIQLLNEKPQRIKAVLAGFLGYKDWIVKL